MRRRWFVIAMTVWALLLVAGWVWFLLKRSAAPEPAPDDTRDALKPPASRSGAAPRATFVPPPV